MSLKYLSILALAGYASAQQNDTVPTLAQALSSTSELSQLQSVLNLNPELVQTLSGANDITILAPSNEAFGLVDNATLTGLTSNTGLLTALLQYHVLNGTFLAKAITNTSAFVPTLLTNPLFTNVTGGQVVEAIAQDGKVTFYSGLLSNSSVSKADVNFTGGVIHIIDRLLVLPENAVDTLSAANLTSLRGAINATGLVDTVNNTPNITIFAPSNEAIQNIGSAFANLTTEQITDILTYHVVTGDIGYSSSLENGTSLTTANGGNLTIIVGTGGIFVNNARVITSDVLIANGVVHVIDEVLNPTNKTLADPASKEGKPAFEGATPASDVPYTSGQPTPTNTINAEATKAADPTRSGAMSASTAGAPQAMKTGAVGMGALFGAAAVYMM
ncbi:Fasciclin-domain-containing protein [Cucurbitaria berberidis CBS 394.84]|uniref:Fasciclin-domain-containing protein n=1 Tax=Cucurbitaria berberidis CBS 394.84 TaxID=1168544 RepID=A0A9P4GA22_9PLEO|nr:Fasciclin-domain-containing protein [Cucurbitaria berberidis CBS 394.84]KAF1841953.1 Fasciclin-domain-containing protein [Cucurbitaria berberidis CBS 394.84]